jgi:hypothetical protein
MKKIGRISLYILLGSFIFIQFLRVEKNVSHEVSPNDFLVANHDLPEMLQSAIKTSCYDCHSNNTNYPWYAHIAPFSWIIDQHIRNGKHELNFSQFDTLSSKKKIAILDEICEVVGDSTMPPQNYLMLHRDAALDFDDISALCDWIDAASFRIMREK